MKRKLISIIALVSFLNYMNAGCTQMTELKILKEEMNESIYSERIVSVVLRNGEKYEFSTPATFEESHNSIKGVSRDGEKISIDLRTIFLKEIRTSKPETIPVKDIDGIKISEIVLNDNKFKISNKDIWFFNRYENKLESMRNNEVVYQCPADSIKEVRISAPTLISKEELIRNPETNITEVRMGNKLVVFDDQGGSLQKAKYNLTGRLKTGGIVSVSDEEILYVQVERVDAGGTFLASIGVMVLVVGIIALIAMATKQSCPFVYSNTGDKYIFDAEPLGGAVAKGLQKTDYSRLEHLRENDGKYELVFRNEVRETQYLDEIKLLIFDHEEGTTISPDANGTFYQLSSPVPASSIVDELDQDISRFLTKNDGVAWQTYLPRKDIDEFNTERHHLTLTFSKPEGITQAHLVFNGGTAAWGSNMIRKMLELRGDQLDDWYQGINSHGPEYEELYRFIMREELYYMKINIKDKDQWVTAGILTGGGPLITEDRIIPIDLTQIEGDELIIRLDPPPGFWQIDYLAMDYSTNVYGSKYQLPLQYAIDQDDAIVTPLLSVSDDLYHQMPRVGDWFKSEFKVPAQQPGKKRSIFLETTGYYELHIDKTKPAETELIQQLLTTPGKIVNYSIERYFEWYNQQIAAN